MRWKYCLIAVAVVMAMTAAASVWRTDEAEDIVPAGTLGMVLIDIADEESADHYHVEEQGVYVLAVQESSAAYQAGLRSGDRLVLLDGCPVTSTADFAAAQEALRPLQPVSISFSRRNETQLQVAHFLWEAQR